MLVPSWTRTVMLAACLAFAGLTHAQETPVTPAQPTTWTPPPTRPETTPWRASDEPFRPARNAVYVELGGASLIYSVNYERHLIPQLALRVGASFLPVKAGEALLGLPLTLSYVGLRWFEIGAGGSLLYTAGRDARDSWPNLQPVATGFLGFRSHPTTEGGFQFRIGAMVMVASGEAFEGDDNGPPPAVTVFPFAYLSAGGGF